MGTAWLSSAKTVLGAKATAIAASTSTPCTEFRSSLMMFSLNDALESVACMEIAQAASITGQPGTKACDPGPRCYAGTSDQLVEKCSNGLAWRRHGATRRLESRQPDCARPVAATGLC